MTLFDPANSADAGKASGRAKNPKPLTLLLQFDGGSRGNPGPAGVGITLSDAADGTVLYEMGEFLGRCTNNVAEYTGLIRGLAAARILGAQKLSVRSDSELVVRQLNGQYKVKSPDLKPLFQRALELMAAIGDVKVSHVLREGNTRADELANLAMDSGRKIEPLGPPIRFAAKEK